jgi:hypothetical protein
MIAVMTFRPVGNSDPNDYLTNPTVAKLDFSPRYAKKLFV